jgi:hypothetical protein
MDRNCSLLAIVFAPNLSLACLPKDAARKVPKQRAVLDRSEDRGHGHCWRSARPGIGFWRYGTSAFDHIGEHYWTVTGKALLYKHIGWSAEALIFQVKDENHADKQANDSEIGTLEQFYFDDESWAKDQIGMIAGKKFKIQSDHIG